MMRYREIIENSLNELGIADMIKQADNSLDSEAEAAIQSFVGVGPNAADNGEWGGYWHPRRLENIFSTNTNDYNIIARDQLLVAFKPIRNALKQKFGPTIKLYRGQREIDKDAQHRSLLSWTSHPKIAQIYAGFDSYRKRTKVITDQEIDQAIKTYEATGEVTFNNLKYVKIDDEYYDIFDRRGENITDGDDLYGDLKREQQDHQANYDKEEQALHTAQQKIVSADVSLDAVVWITNRANQSEFIVKNIPGSPWYIGLNGMLKESYFYNFKVTRYGKTSPECIVYKNPSRKEYKSLGNSGIRGFLTNNDLYVWNTASALHVEVQNELKFSNPIPVVLYGEIGGECIIVITDFSKKTSWYHNSEVKNEIFNHLFLNKMFNDIEISYFDEDIVGDWTDLDEED